MMALNGHVVPRNAWMKVHPAKPRTRKPTQGHGDPCLAMKAYCVSKMMNCVFDLETAYRTSAIPCLAACKAGADQLLRDFGMKRLSGE